ncbi:MAG: hypothetical protein HUN05_18775 [Desulfobacter sp.]|nr:MAG: hypothetical protein HUN05_18775 [Desulfobacter sp.]
MGIQSPTPFVRTKARKQDKKQLCAQIYGLLTSLHAISLEEQKAQDNIPADHDSILFNYIDTLRTAKDEKLSIPEIVTRDTEKKRARYHNIK